MQKRCMHFVFLVILKRQIIAVFIKVTAWCSCAKDYLFPFTILLYYSAVGCDVCYDVLWQTGKQLVYNYRNRQKTNATLPRKNNSKRKKRTLNTCNTSALLKCQTKANSLTQRRRRARATYRVYNPRLTVWILLMWYELSKSSESDGKLMNINRLMKIPVLGVNYV